jgi:hypothetical protein
VHFFFGQLGEMKLREQIEILATLQNVDREIREKNGIKQELLGELQVKDKEILSKKQEIALLAAACAEKKTLGKEQYCKTKAKSHGSRMRMNRIKNIKSCKRYSRD